MLPPVLGRDVDGDIVLRRENFVATGVEVLARTCPSEKHKRGTRRRSDVGGGIREAIAGRCGDRVRCVHAEVLRGGRSQRNGRGEHVVGHVVGVRNRGSSRGSSRYLRGTLREQGSDGGGEVRGW